MKLINWRIGYWAALVGVAAIVVYTVCFGIILSRQPIFTWTNLADYLDYTNRYGSPLADIARFATMVMAFALAVMLSGLGEGVRPEQRILARNAYGFGLAFAILTSVYYFVQISAVRLNVLQENYVGLEQVVQANPYSAFSALNMLAWSFCLGTASFFAAPLFSEGRLERLIRWLFLVNGVCCLLSGIAYIFEITALLLITVNLGTGGALLGISITLSRFYRSRA